MCNCAAFKCNNHPRIASHLVALGCNFDCASKGEITQVLKAGATPERIVYAHPIKQIDHLESARDQGVRLTVFDNEDELHKIKAIHPKTRLLLRLRTDDHASKCQFSEKFGADLGSVRRLYTKAKELGLKVVGVSYHVGSGCYDPDTYVRAIRNARLAFDMGISIGHSMYVLDIGGGFPGSDPGTECSELGTSNAVPDGSASSFGEIASVIRRALADWFPAEPLAAMNGGHSLSIMAEPGRYMVETSHTIMCQVIGKRRIIPEELTGGAGGRGPLVTGADLANAFLANSATGLLQAPALATGGDAAPVPAHIAQQHAESFKVYINDGLYGLMNNVVYDHVYLAATPIPKVLLSKGFKQFKNYAAASTPLTPVVPTVTEEPDSTPEVDSDDAEADVLPLLRRPLRPTSVWGPTCDGFDCVFREIWMPETQLGDWMAFENMGAYTVAGACEFNGFELAEPIFVNSTSRTVFDEDGGED